MAPEIIGIDAARTRPAIVPPSVGIAEQSAPGGEPRSRRHSPGRRQRLAAVVVGPAGRPLAFAKRVAATIGVDLAAGNQTVLGILDLPLPIEMEMLAQSPPPPAPAPVPGGHIHPH